MGVAEDEIFCRRDGIWVRVGEGCRGEGGGATGGGEGRPVAAAPRGGEVKGEAATAKAEAGKARVLWVRVGEACRFGCAWGRGSGGGEPQLPY